MVLSEGRQLLLQNEDGLPPMLMSTPKGTGGGYGVGFDMESMMAYNPDLLK